MKKIIIALALMICLIPATSLATGNAHAVAVLNEVCTNPHANGSPAICSNGGQADSNNPIYTILKVVIDVLGAVVGVASVIVIIVQGLRMVASNGDTKSIEEARNGILYAIIGIIFAVLSQVFVDFILKRFTT